MAKQAQIVATKNGVPANDDVVQRRLASLEPKRQFMFQSMNMGWQLAGAVLIPVAIGVKLDDHFATSPSYTLAALVLAAGGAVAIVNNTIKQVRRDQAEADKLEEKNAK